jgi:thiol-disulfide isomerase/thioredoxin
LAALRSLADLRRAQEREDEAEQLLRDLVDRSTRVHGEDASLTRQVRGDLGSMLVRQGRLEEAAVVYGNKRMPDSLGIEEWLQGEASLLGNDPTVLIFWESWCPFSQQQVPEFEVVSRPFREMGLTLAGFSRTDEPEGQDRLSEFIREKGITFPSARTTPESWSYFDVAGTPSAAAIRNGKVVFEGYLDHVTEEFLAELVAPTP